jgi:hypothetical protein
LLEGSNPCSADSGSLIKDSEQARINDALGGLQGLSAPSTSDERGASYVEARAAEKIFYAAINVRKADAWVILLQGCAEAPTCAQGCGTELKAYNVARLRSEDPRLPSDLHHPQMPNVF